MFISIFKQRTAAPWVGAAVVFLVRRTVEDAGPYIIALYILIVYQPFSWARFFISSRIRVA